MAVVVYVPSRLGEGFFADLAAPTAGDDAKAITYDHGTGAFVYAAAGGSGTPPGSDTQLIFNDGGAYGADPGLTYAKATDRLTVAGGLVAPSMRPATNSTTALQLQNAAGAAILTVDTLGGRVTLARATITTGFISSSIQPASDTTGVNVLNAAGTTVAYFSTSNKRLGLNIVPVQTIHAYDAAHSIGLYQGALTARIRLQCDASAVGGKNFEFSSRDQSFQFSSLADGWGSYINQHIMVLTPVGNVGVSILSPTALFDIAASTTARASLRVRSGVAPTTPNVDGDMWNDGNAYAVMVNGTNAVNTDGGLSVWMQSSLQARNVGRLLWQYTDKTDATRITEGSLTAYYQSTERKAMRWSADSNGPTLAFYNGTPVAKAAAYTQTYSTADRTLSAYTADDESGAYSGIDNAQAGSVYAQLTDLNALRTATENLRAFVEDLAGVLNSHTDDLQALNLVG